MNRLEMVFSNLKTSGRKALVSFTMAGDPDRKASISILHNLAQSADILELGMPFTDPMADGPAVQAAGLRALANGADLKMVFSIVEEFRSKNNDTPIVLMGYFNPIMAFGIDAFISNCSELGVDGVIIVDLPPEEADELAPKAQQKSISFIRLLTPTTDEARLSKILGDATGFLYYVSITGVTGTASADPVKVGAHIAMIKKHTDLPIVAGFGIKTAQDAAAMAKVADGVVVGSAFVQMIEGNAQNDNLLNVISEKANLFKTAISS